MNNDYGSKLGGREWASNPISMVCVRNVTLRLALSARKREMREKREKREKRENLT